MYISANLNSSKKLQSSEIGNGVDTLHVAVAALICTKVIIPSNSQFQNWDNESKLLHFTVELNIIGNIIGNFFFVSINDIYCTVGDTANVKLTVQPAENFPVDLYYLMDMSWSMRDDLTNLKKLAKKIGKELKLIHCRTQILLNLASGFWKPLFSLLNLWVKISK